MTFVQILKRRKVCEGADTALGPTSPFHLCPPSSQIVYERLRLTYPPLALLDIPFCAQRPLFLASPIEEAV